MAKYFPVDLDNLHRLIEFIASPQEPKAAILPYLTQEEQKEFEILDTRGKILLVLLKRKKVIGYKRLGLLAGVCAKTVERYLKSAPLKDIVVIGDVIRDPRNNRIIGSPISLVDWEASLAIYNEVLNKSREFYSILE